MFSRKPGQGTVSVSDNEESERNTGICVTGYLPVCYEDEIRQGFISVFGSGLE